MNKGWIGIDLDGTLVEYKLGDCAKAKCGITFPNMLAKIKEWEAKGYKVKIFTARAKDPSQAESLKKFLSDYGLEHLEITNEKDYSMVELWDDRAVQVLHNQGISLVEAIEKAIEIYRHNWTCDGCDGYENSTNPPNDEPMCENCQEIADLLKRIELAMRS